VGSIQSIHGNWVIGQRRTYTDEDGWWFGLVWLD